MSRDLVSYVYMDMTERKAYVFDNVDEAHARLQDYATANDLDVHLHPGSWHGTNVCSTAYRRGGDMMLDAEAAVVPSYQRPRPELAPLRRRVMGDAEYWQAWAMFPAAVGLVAAKEWLDQHCTSDSGGLRFANRPTVYLRGRFIFCYQSGGMDI